jgi:hypothetical protein
MPATENDPSLSAGEYLNQLNASAKAGQHASVMAYVVGLTASMLTPEQRAEVLAYVARDAL